MAWVNPSVLLTMACRGKGPFQKRLPLRTIAVFPSWDVMGFAVHESTGITSLAQIAQERFRCGFSTGNSQERSQRAARQCLPCRAVLKAAGFSLAEMRRWGGKIHEVPRPSDPEPARRHRERRGQRDVRRRHQELGPNGIWNNGFRYLPVDGNVLQSSRSAWLPPGALSRSDFRARRSSSDRGFQRLADDRARRHGRRGRLRAVRSHRTAQGSLSDRQLSSRSAWPSFAPMTTRRPTMRRCIPAPGVSIANAAYLK